MKAADLPPLVPRLVTAPSVEPITLQQAKDHLRVDGDDDNDYIESLITAARERIEASLNRSLITTTWKVTLDRFPGGWWEVWNCGQEWIELPRPRLISVSSIVYTDTNGTSTTWSSSNYTVDTQSEPGRVMPAYNAVWPTARDHIAVVTITYTAGYGAAATAVPASIKHAMKLLVSHMYELREPVNVGNIVTEIPMSIDYLLAAEKWTPL